MRHPHLDGCPTLRIYQEGVPLLVVVGILDRLIFRPRKIKAAREYFTERFGPAFFMRPDYCYDCNKKPVYNEATAQEAERINRRIPFGEPMIDVGTLVPSCPECNWVMDLSPWERFIVGFSDGSFTVEQFEKWERKTYMNGNFESETLNGANQDIVSHYSFSRETIVTDTDTGRTIEQIPRKNRPFSIIFNLVILLLISLPAYFALTAKDADGTLEFPGGEICLLLPICWVLLFAFANRKSVTVTIRNDMISQIVKKGNRVISEEEVEISKINSAIMRFTTDTVEIGEIERSLGKSRHGITYEEAKFESNKLGHGNGTFRTLEILGELDGKEITLMETKFYDSTGAGNSNAMYASEKVMEELRKLGVLK